MYPIKVLGRGLIPEGFGLAPRKNVFKASKRAIMNIICAPGLEVYLVHPVTKKSTKLTRLTFSKILDDYDFERTGKRQDPGTLVSNKPQPAIHPCFHIAVNDMYVPINVTVESVLSGAMKGEKEWYIHRGGNVYTALDERFCQTAKASVEPPKVPKAKKPYVPNPNQLFVGGEAAAKASIESYKPLATMKEVGIDLNHPANQAALKDAPKAILKTNADLEEYNAAIEEIAETDPEPEGEDITELADTDILEGSLDTEEQPPAPVKEPEPEGDLDKGFQPRFSNGNNNHKKKGKK